jgi:hypothetical protein
VLRDPTAFRRIAALVGPTVVVATVMAVASGCGAAKETDATRRAEPVSPGTLAERGRADLDARDWLGSRTPPLRELGAALVENRVFLNALSYEGNTASVRGTLARITGELGTAREGLSILLPTGVTEFEAVDAKMSLAARLATRGFADYKSSLDQNLAAGIPLDDDTEALAVLARGQDAVSRAIVLVRSLQRWAAALNTEYLTNG